MWTNQLKVATHFYDAQASNHAEKNFVTIGGRVDFLVRLDFLIL